MAEQGDHFANGEKKLDLLFKKIPFYVFQSESKKKRSENTPKLAANDAVSGRYVTIVVKSTPFIVKKRFLKPKLNSNLSIQFAVQILRKICGKINLFEVLVLITPATDSEVKNRLKMHCFVLRTKKHLGVTSLTIRELELIEKYHSSNNYALIFSTRNIDLEDLAKNSPIQAEIFETAKSQSNAVRQICYHGNAVGLVYRTSDKMRLDLSPEGNSISLKSQKPPKVRVRVQTAFKVPDNTRLSKRYGWNHCTSSNLARQRRLDYPGFGRRVFLQPINHNRRLRTIKNGEFLVYVPNELFMKGIELEAKRRSLLKRKAKQAKKVKLEESQIKNYETQVEETVIDNLKESGHKNSTNQYKNSIQNDDLLNETSIMVKSEEKSELSQSKVERKPKSNKMRIQIVRKERAQIDREKAHQAGKKEKECIKMARQVVMAYRNAKVESKKSSHVKNTSVERKATLSKNTTNRSGSKDQKMHQREQSNTNTSSNNCKSVSFRTLKLNQAIHFNNQSSESYISEEVNQRSIDSVSDSQLDEISSIERFEEIFIYKPFNEEFSLDKIEKLTVSAFNAFIKGEEVLTLDIQHSFCQFARVIEAINRESYPQDKHLYLFFKIAEILSFKIFARREYNFPGFATAKEPRCRLECYIHGDRKDFIASVGILNRQLKMFRDYFPNVAINMRCINDPFVLTNMPKAITNCIKSFLPSNIYYLLGELTYEWIQQPSTVTTLARELDLNELLE